MSQGHKGLFFFIFLLFGIMLTLQFRGMMETKPSLSAKEMASKLEAEKAEGKQLMETLNGVEAERDQLLNNIGYNDVNPEVRDLIQKRDSEYLRAGLLDVKGDGIVITLQDAEVLGTTDVEDYIIHDADIYSILYELWTYGAQAIAINGERMIATSRLVCAGPNIFLNRSRYPPPYVIEAIGDPDSLYNAIDQMTNVAIMRIYDIRIDIQKVNDITVEKYKLYESIEKFLNRLEVVQQ